MPEPLESKRQPGHFTWEEYRFLTGKGLSKTEKFIKWRRGIKEWLEKEGLRLNSGYQEVYIDGKKKLMSTGENTFGDLREPNDNA